MDKRFKTGKQLYDAAKDAQAITPSPKSLDFVRLSSESTRENPRLLGGTAEDGNKYLESLDPQQLEEYNKFLRLRTHLSYIGDKQGTAKARSKYPLGHEIELEYKKRCQLPESEGDTSNPSKK